MSARLPPRPPPTCSPAHARRRRRRDAGSTAGRSLHRSATTWSPRSSTSTRPSTGCLGAQGGAGARSSRRGSTGWPPRSPSRLAVGGGAARSAAPSTTPTWPAPAPGAPDAAAEKALRRRLDDAEVERLARAEHAPRPRHPGRGRPAGRRHRRHRPARQALAEVRDGDASAEATRRRPRRPRGPPRARPRPTRCRRPEPDRAHRPTGRARRHRSRPSTESRPRSTAELADALGDAHATLASLLDHLDAVVARPRRGARRLRAAETARRAARRRRADALDARAREAGFADAASALAAVLGRRRDRPLRGRRRRPRTGGWRPLTAVLDDPALRRRGAVEAARPRRAGRRPTRLARRCLGRAAHAPSTARPRAPRLGRARRPSCRGALDAWAPVRAELDARHRAGGVRRGQVPRQPRCRCGCRPTSWATGSPRSSTPPTPGWPRMSDQRYSLEHTGRRGAGRAPGRPEPAGPRRLVRRDPRPGDAVRRRDVRGLAGAGAGAGRRDHPRGRRRRRSTRCSSTRASARSTPTPSTT